MSSSNEIEIILTCVDEASAEIASASDNIANSLDVAAEAQNSLAQATEGTVQPFNSATEAENSNRSASDTLTQSQNNLTTTTYNLGDAVQQSSTYYSNAEREMDGYAATQVSIGKTTVNVGDSSDQAAGSIKNFTVGISGAATAGFNFYNSFDNVHRAQVSLDRSNLMLQRSTFDVKQAEDNLTSAREKGDPTAISDAETKLDLARQNLELSTERQQMAEDNVNRSMTMAALQVIPTTITMVDSLTKAWNNFPDMTGMLKTLSTNISTVGNNAKLAAVGVTAFVGGFTIGYTVIKQFGEALGPVGRALMVVVPAIIAAAAAVWMLQEGITLGVATIALAVAGIAVGAMVANLESYGNVAGLAAGGVVDHPMLAWIGEGIGANQKEIVMPLSQYEAQRAEQLSTQPNSNLLQEVTIINLSQNIYGDINSEADEDRVAEKAVELIDRRSNRRRNI